jgi:hypothetical protein
MSALPLPEQDGGGRYPGFSVLDQSPHWDARTREVVLARLASPPRAGFFDDHELATASALADRLLAQDAEPRIPVAIMIGQRLAAGETDGWHYEDMPEDGEAWRRSLAGLDEDAHRIADADFGEASAQQQRAVIGAVQDLGDAPWHGMPAVHVWSLWTRYATTAFYAHPWAWEEIGFGGPAYPRGYKNLGVGRREPFEVADVRVDEDPVHP